MAVSGSCLPCSFCIAKNAPSCILKYGISIEAIKCILEECSSSCATCAKGTICNTIGKINSKLGQLCCEVVGGCSASASQVQNFPEVAKLIDGDATIIKVKNDYPNDVDVTIKMVPATCTNSIHAVAMNQMPQKTFMEFRDPRSGCKIERWVPI